MIFMQFRKIKRFQSVRVLRLYIESILKRIIWTTIHDHTYIEKALE